MLVDILLLLVLVSVVVCTLLLARFISSNVKKDREVIRAREDRLNVTVRLLKEAISKIDVAERRFIEQQNLLDEKLDEVIRLMGAHNIYVNLQHEQFNELAKSDMLAARRDELFRTKELKVALERIMGMALTSRQPPATIDVLAMESVENRIKELEKILENDTNEERLR